MKIWLIVFGVGFEHIEKGFYVFFFDEWVVFGEGDSEDGDDCSFFGLVGLFAFVFDEMIPHVCEGLRFDDGDGLADWLCDDGF